MKVQNQVLCLYPSQYCVHLAVLYLLSNVSTQYCTYSVLCLLSTVHTQYILSTLSTLNVFISELNLHQCCSCSHTPDKLDSTPPRIVIRSGECTESERACTACRQSREVLPAEVPEKEVTTVKMLLWKISGQLRPGNSHKPQKRQDTPQSYGPRLPCIELIISNSLELQNKLVLHLVFF